MISSILIVKIFYQHVMQQRDRGLRLSKMSAIVHKLGWQELRGLYDQNRHGTLNDVEASFQLSISKKLIKRFLGWEHFQLQLGPGVVPDDVSKRSQSVNRFRPGCINSNNIRKR